MKKHLFRSTLICLLAAYLLASLLSGCVQVKDPDENTKPSSSATKVTEQEKITLRLLVEDDLGGVAEKTASDMFHMYLGRFVRGYSFKNENVEIVVEEIPTGVGREEALQRLRAEIMMGEGPDMILLPSSPTQYYDLSEYVEPLFADVRQAMGNGLFLDIGTYYDADSELDKEALNQTVMDAGIYEGARYVLPLSYNMPVAYVAKEAFAQSGVPQDIFTYGAADLMNAVAQMEDPAAAANFYQTYTSEAPLIFNFFPELIDYETGEVAVTPEELTEYLRAWQNCQARLGEASAEGQIMSYTRDLFVYFVGGFVTYWTENDFFASCDSLLRAADNVLLANHYDVELDMYPLRAIDGSVVADVTMYTAVTSGCEHPELAYDFLRQFLGEEFQWQTGEIHSDLDFFGWPVRIKGSANPVCDVDIGTNPISGENVTDTDMPILNAKIDHVRFPIPLETEFAKAVEGLYDARNKVPVEIDLDQMAREWINKLQVHIDES